MVISEATLFGDKPATVVYIILSARIGSISLHYSHRLGSRCGRHQADSKRKGEISHELFEDIERQRRGHGRTGGTYMPICDLRATVTWRDLEKNACHARRHPLMTRSSTPRGLARDRGSESTCAHTVTHGHSRSLTTTTGPLHEYQRCQGLV